MKFEFHNAETLLKLCDKHDCQISEVMIQNEMARNNLSQEDVMEAMQRNLDVMKSSIEQGLDAHRANHGVFSGHDAILMKEYASKSYIGKEMAEIIAASIAVVEVNASMGRIVAAPTAGASGILPAVLIGTAKQRNFTDEQLCKALCTAGAVGCILAENASIAGASGGCQAETGSGAAMAAAALTELSGGTPEMCLDAAGYALNHVMGLVCDPVGGLVECPCIKRNAMGAANAILSCDMALAGMKSLFPFDEVVLAMKRVSDQMHPDLKETGKGGLASTPTAKRLVKEWKKRQEMGQ